MKGRAPRSLTARSLYSPFNAWDYKGQFQHIGPLLPEPLGQNNPVLTSTNIDGNRRTCWIAVRVREPRSISDPEQVFPLAKFAVKAHALGDLEG